MEEQFARTICVCPYRNMILATFSGPLIIPKLYNGRQNRTFFFSAYEYDEDIGLDVIGHVGACAAEPFVSCCLHRRTCQAQRNRECFSAGLKRRSRAFHHFGEVRRTPTGASPRASITSSRKPTTGSCSISWAVCVTCDSLAAETGWPRPWKERHGTPTLLPGSIITFFGQGVGPDAFSIFKPDAGRGRDGWTHARLWS